MTLFRIIALALLTGSLFVAGCDEHAVSDGAAEVVLDVRSLFRTTAGERCVSVADSLRLTVTEAGGATQILSRPLTADDTEIRIPVEVEEGRTRFEAEVRSNNGVRLYAGSASASVGSAGFEVVIDLGAVDGVLQACPDLVPLAPADNAYRGTLRLINRGSRSVAWTAVFDSPLCDNEPCFLLRPDAGTLAAGDTVALDGVYRLAEVGDAVDVRITAAVGTLDVPFVAGPDLVAGPDSFAPSPGPTLED